MPHKGVKFKSIISCGQHFGFPLPSGQCTGVSGLPA